MLDISVRTVVWEVDHSIEWVVSYPIVSLDLILNGSNRQKVIMHKKR